jgi:hypothetical protein
MKAIAIVGAVALALAAGAAHKVGGEAAATAPAPVPEVAPPRSPAPYRLPGGALHVNTSAGLRKALARRAPRDIVLAPGIYDNAGPFENRYSHRLYAAKLGKAILRAGLSIGGDEDAAGAVARGLVVDVRDTSKTRERAAVAVWGLARNAKVLDTRIDGHGTLSAGIMARQPDGFEARRMVARNFTGYGVFVDANEANPQPGLAPVIVEDVDVANVSRRPPRSSNGTAEACVWLGNTGTLRRVRVRNCAWMGVWTGTAARHAVIRDVDVDRTPTGVYIEHFTTASTFERIHVRSSVRIGVVAEWASPEWGGRPASVDNVIQDSLFESALCGVYLDEGTTRTAVRRSVFRKQTWAAIGDFRGVGNTYAANDYSGIAPGAVSVSHNHISRAR